MSVTAVTTRSSLSVSPSRASAGNEPCKRFSVSLGETRPAAPPPAAAAPAPAPLAGPLSAPSRVAQVMSKILSDEKAVDQGLARALRGGAASPQELLALQVQVMRYSQAIEVASRIVEKVTGAVKQTLQTQV